MKGGSKLFIFAGVALALVAIVLGIASVKGGKTEAQNKPVVNVTVVQALKDVPAHTVLTAADIAEVLVPNTEPVDGVVTSAGAVIGQSYSVKLTTGQRLQSALVEVPGLANVIKPGLRAMALPVTTVSALGGLVQDDNYIDIVFHARINLMRVVNSNLGNVPEDGYFQVDKAIAADPKSPVIFPAAGDPGSVFQVRDGVGDDGQMEPVAKIVLQDIHVLRILAPGESFNGDGSVTQPTPSSDGVSPASTSGQLVVEVTPQQAELVTFIQDAKQSYQVTVRAKGDHAQVSTTGITYEILVDNATWDLPVPKSITSPGGTPVADYTGKTATSGGGGAAGASAGNGASIKGNGSPADSNSTSGNGAGV